MTKSPAAIDSAKRRRRVTREVLAAVFWIYVLLKLAVFDIDIYIFQRFFPRLLWLVEAKVFVVIGLVAVAWVVLGRREFPRTIAYVLAYPFVILFWKLPKIAFRRWPLFIAFAPGIYRAATTFRTTYELYAMAIISCLAIEIGSNRVMMLVAMVAMSGFLVAHLYRSFRKAYSSSVFNTLSEMVRKVRDSIERGSFDHSPQQSTQTKSVGSPSGNPGTSDPSNLYLLRCFTDIVYAKVQAVA